MQKNQRYMLPNGRLDRDRADRDMRAAQARQLKRIMFALFHFFRRSAPTPQDLRPASGKALDA